MPVPDIDAYTRHCVMQPKAEELMSQREYKLARAMAERCVEFYDTLGMHWLAFVCARVPLVWVYM